MWKILRPNADHMCIFTRPFLSKAPSPADRRRRHAQTAAAPSSIAAPPAIVRLGTPAPVEAEREAAAASLRAVTL